jgi:hypothetical protein
MNFCPTNKDLISYEIFCGMIFDPVWIHIKDNLEPLSVLKVASNQEDVGMHLVHWLDRRYLCPVNTVRKSLGLLPSNVSLLQIE